MTLVLEDPEYPYSPSRILKPLLRISAKDPQAKALHSEPVLVFVEYETFRNQGTPCRTQMAGSLLSGTQTKVPLS